MCHFSLERRYTRKVSYNHTLNMTNRCELEEVLSHHIISYCIISSYLTLSYRTSDAVLCCAVLCCAVLCCAVLCCAVLCCAVLYCAVLCCAAIFYNLMSLIRCQYHYIRFHCLIPLRIHKSLFQIA